MRSALLFLIALGLPSLTAADVVVPIDSVEQFVNIRAETSVDSYVIGRLYKGDNLLHVQSVEGWHEVQIEPGLNGYISSDWGTVFADAEAAAAAYAAARMPVIPEPEPEAATAETSVPAAITGHTNEVLPEEIVEEAPAEVIFNEEPAPEPPVEAEEVEASDGVAEADAELVNELEVRLVK